MQAPNVVLMHHHPWRDFRSREHLTLYQGKLPPGMHAATDGETIYMEKRLLQVERRCALTHELVHIDLGHTKCQGDKDESVVEKITARRLIDWTDLVDAFKWAHDQYEAADELWVTPEVFVHRLRYLHPHERALLKMIGVARNE